MRKIIDISSAQGFVHWPLVGETVDAVILKAADGHFEDNGAVSSYTINRLKADRYGVPVEAVYGWWYPNSQLPGQTTASMANALWKYASGAKVVLDLELFKNTTWNPAWKVDVQNHLAALDQLIGAPAIAYLGVEMATHLANADGTFPAWLTSRKLWWPQYPTLRTSGDQWNLSTYAFQAPTNVPKALQPFIWLWQFSGNGKLPGIPGNSVDLNYEVNSLAPIPQPAPAPAPAPTSTYPAYKAIAGQNPNVHVSPDGSSKIICYILAGTTVYVDTVTNGYGHIQPAVPYLSGGWIWMENLAKV